MKMIRFLLLGSMLSAAPFIFAQTTMEVSNDTEESSWDEISVEEEDLVAMRLLTQGDAGVRLTKAEWRTEQNQVNEVRLELEGEMASLVRRNEILIQQNVELVEKNEMLKAQNDILAELNQSVLAESDAIVEGDDFVDEYDEEQINRNRQLVESNERKINAHEEVIMENERLVEDINAMVEENEELIQKYTEMIESVEDVSSSNEILISED